MPSLIPELITASLDPTVSVASLLQRGLVAASRLGVPDLVSWMSCEINGYSGSPVPNYRKIRGVLVCEDEFGAWGPVEFRNSTALKMISTQPIPVSIAELEQLIVRGDSLIVFFSHANEELIRQGMRPQRRPAVEIQSTQVYGLIQQVRNQILQWALDLESKSVRGEGMSFSLEERQIVAAQHYHFGDVTGSQIQIGSSGSNQSLAPGDSTGALNALINLLSDVLARNEIDGDVAAELVAELKTLEAQAESPRPKASIIRETALSIQRVLEGAAGNVLATAAPLIHSLVS